MSHITSSTFSPPSVIGSDSIDSEVVSVTSLGSDEALKLHVPENYKGDKVFELGDGDIDIQVNGVTFQTHKYLLKRFNNLKAMLQHKSSRRSDKPLTLERENGAEDFLKTFKVLYATPLEGSIDFDPPTLTSALRIATIYDYPALRKFAITGLEKASLSAIERIRIAREFRLTSWEEPAYVELCERDEAITEQEANILGIGAFVQVAKIREKEQRRKGRDIDEWEGDEAENNDAHLCNPQTRDISLLATSKVQTTPVPILKKSKTKKSARTSGNGADNVTTGSSISKEESKALEQNKNLCFVNASKPRSTSYHSYGSDTLEVEVPGCKCVSDKTAYNQVLGRQINPGVKCICKISPCTADALEHLQAQQYTQADSITKLESAIQDMRIALVTPKPHTIQSDPSLFNSDESTSVRIDVRSWLSLGV